MKISKEDAKAQAMQAINNKLYILSYACRSTYLHQKMPFYERHPLERISIRQYQNRFKDYARSRSLTAKEIM